MGRYIAADVTRLGELQSPWHVRQKLQRIPASMAAFGVGRIRSAGDKASAEEALGTHGQHHVDGPCKLHEAADYASATG